MRIGFRTRRRRLVDQHDFAVLEILFGQHQPRAGHNEQRAFTFRIIEGVGKFETFFGIAPILLYPLVSGHAPGPHRVKRRMTIK